MAMLIQDEQKDNFKFLAGSTDESSHKMVKLHRIFPALNPNPWYFSHHRDLQVSPGVSQG